MNSATPLIPRAVAAFPGPGLLWRTGVAITTLGIITGAFGAHGLQKRQDITPKSIHAWETAAHYAIANGLGLMLVSLHPRFAFHRFAGPAIAAGTLMFSGSIMALVLNKDLKPLGPVTPLGGLVLISGYLALAL